MRASLLIAAHNEGESLGKTIRSCIDAANGLEYEIVVADDASTDDSVEKAK
jgi:glycosyltransferase involved in cell wall biosynthesis